MDELMSDERMNDERMNLFIPATPCSTFRVGAALMFAGAAELFDVRGVAAGTADAALMLR